jgi:hypothetical protein
LADAHVRFRRNEKILEEHPAFCSVKPAIVTAVRSLEAPPPALVITMSPCPISGPGRNPTKTLPQVKAVHRTGSGTRIFITGWAERGSAGYSGEIFGTVAGRGRFNPLVFDSSWIPTTDKPFGLVKVFT